jgi:hypothetical protein
MSKETFTEREQRLDRESADRIYENMQGALEALEEAVAGMANPNTANLQTVFNLMQQRQRVANRHLELTPEEQLRALDDVENWYVSQGAVYPQQRRLEQQRSYWKTRMNVTG